MELEKIYKAKQENNPHEYSRSNFIKKIMEDSFQDFQGIIFKEAEEINENCFNKFFSLLPESLKEKIFQRFLAEGLISEDKLNSNTTFGCLTGISLASLGATVSVHLNRARAIALGKTIAAGAAIGLFPVFGLTTFVIKNFASAICLSSNHIGWWKKENTYRDISEILFKWFIEKKGEILNKYLESFNTIIDGCIESFKNKKETSQKIKNILEIVNKFENSENINHDFDFKKEDLIGLIKNEKLKEFILESLEFKN